SLGIKQGILGRIYNYVTIVNKANRATNTPNQNIKEPNQYRSNVNKHIEENH
ncbi:PH domain-containing protein, partial [Enterobacter roggenkampii]